MAGFALGGVLSGVLVENAGVREALIAAAAAAPSSVAIAWVAPRHAARLADPRAVTATKPLVCQRV